MEITYSRFEKTLEFPASIEGAKLEHNFTDGLLLIHLKKR
jgi:HSP20 family molecular chaperone IbpA